MSTRVVTAETDEGRAAVEEVMAHSYRADTEEVQPAWLRALMVDDVPVSFIGVEPDLTVDLPRGQLRAAFVSDVATREDRRREGHFRRLMEMTCADLREAGISLLTLHGTCRYYRPLGFCVCTHQCGLFITPDTIEQHLGPVPEEVREGLLEVDDDPSFVSDLLVCGVRARTSSDAAAALHAASVRARKHGKTRILFEHPRADHTLHSSLETPFTELARICGAEMIVGSADPEGRRVDHADWYKVLDTYRFLRDAVPLCPVDASALPKVAVTFETELGTTTLRRAAEGVTVTDDAAPDACRLTWPANAVGQLALGYLSAAALAAVYGTAVPPEPLALLDGVFPRGWRLSRNEQWVYGGRP